MKPTVPRDPRFDHLRRSHDGACWWCGAVADSQEHKYKRTDLALLGGNGDLLWGGDPQKPYIIKSLRRDPAVRFARSLCNRCNSARSQPFDRAYDKYRSYIWRRLDQLWWHTRLDMYDIYGADWPNQQLQLARYFVKHFGCRLVDEGFHPPAQMARFLDGHQEMSNVHLAFIKRKDLWLLRRKMRSLGESGDMLSLDGLGAELSPDEAEVRRLVTATYVGYLGVRFDWILQQPVELSSFYPARRSWLNRLENEDQLLRPPPPTWRERLLHRLFD